MPQQPPLRLLCSWRSCLHPPDSDVLWVRSLVGCHLLHSPPCHWSQRRKMTEALLMLTTIMRVKLLWLHKLPQVHGIKSCVISQKQYLKIDSPKKPLEIDCNTISLQGSQDSCYTFTVAPQQLQAFQPHNLCTISQSPSLWEITHNPVKGQDRTRIFKYIP